ncbi:MAG: ThuA domain-containing protein [Verrucomicrobia bacterium]|nr:ThuA domain-containing protein [Verrucomicrobiota bacterium]
MTRNGLVLTILAGLCGGQQRPAMVSPEEQSKIAAALPKRAAAKPRQPRRLLVVDSNTGRGGHRSIPHANLAVELMGKQLGAWTTVNLSDAAVWRSERLREFDAVFLNNTIGDIFGSGAARESFAAFVRNGGGVIGNHATSVTAPGWPEFERILGAKGAMHRMPDEKVTIRLDEPKSPLNAGFPRDGFVFADEMFRFNTERMRTLNRVLLSIDVARTDMNQGRCFGTCTNAENDYPVSWIRRYGKGRVFYCSLGHNPSVFWDAPVLAHFLAGIQFALGDLKAGAKPVEKRR